MKKGRKEGIRRGEGKEWKESGKRSAKMKKRERRGRTKGGETREIELEEGSKASYNRKE